MKYFLLLSILIPFISFSQVNWQNLQQKSSETFAYKISAIQAEYFIKKDSINVDAFLSQQPYKVFKIDSVDESQLQIDHYVLVSINDNKIVANLIGVSNLFVYTVNNQHRVQLAIQNNKKEFINNAQVWVNDKAAKQDKSSGNYIIKQKYPDEAEVKIYTPGDTLFSSVWAKDDMYNTVWQQRWRNFKSSRFTHIISWVPKKIVGIFKDKDYRSYSNIGSGTVVFNQPKYKTTDTVKLKAYIFDKHWKQYKNVLNVYLEYYDKGSSKQRLLTSLKPSHAGSFIYQFPLSDTLTNDVNYRIVFRDDKQHQLVSGNFKIEDYLPDEISKTTLRSSKKNYYPNDSIHFYVSSTDANGLQLLDAKATLILTAENINHFYKDSMYVPDTLFTQEKFLQTEGETKFSLSTKNLTDADLNMNAVVVLKNSNNELQQANQNISFIKANDELTSKVVNDSLIVEYKLNGESVRAKGLMVTSGDEDKKDSVLFPLRIKIDPFVTNYSFYVIENSVITDSSQTNIETYYNVDLSRISNGDTLGFTLNNPNKIPVSFSIFYGNKIVGSGRDDKENIEYKFLPSSKHHIYTVKWQYYWANEEQTRQQTIALLYKVLKIDINSNEQIFPGQKDTIKINVADYKNKPAADVNLTAVSYNNQLQKDIRVNEPPYLVKYHNRQFLLHDKFEKDDGYIIKNYSLGKHKLWLQKFGMDSLPYYKMLFPQKQYKDFVTQITEYIPQVAVHVTNNGDKQEVYLLYINKQLVYYNGVTEKSAEAFSCFPGYAKLGIRLLDKFIETDSIYMQPFYKHDIFIDVDNVDSNTAIKSMPKYYTDPERNLLERSIWQLDNNYSTNSSYVWQNDKLYKLYRDVDHILGPFTKNDSMHFYVPKKFDISFMFESGYQYNISPKILRLKKTSLFDVNKAQIPLSLIQNTYWNLGDTIIDHPVIDYSAKSIIQPLFKVNYYSSYYKSQGKGQLLFTLQKDTVAQFYVLYNEANKKKSLITNQSLRKFTNVDPGYYTLLIITKNLNVCRINHLLVKADTTLCINANNYPFKHNDSLLNELAKPDEPQPIKQVLVDNTKLDYYEKGKASITGKVIDKKGKNPVPFATISIKGTKTVVATSADGIFILNNIKSGKITLVISAVGSLSKEVLVDVDELHPSYLNIALEVTSSSLSDVEVTTALGVQRQNKSLGYSTVTIRNELTGAIQGKVAGLAIYNDDGNVVSSPEIRIRGNSSFANNQNPIYVVDGIIYDQMPVNITPDMIGDINTLKGEEAVSIYGSRATDGAIIISTKLKNSRTQFRDYAFWQPEIFTNENGHASFVVEYPDNITGWQTYVLAMDKKRRIGKAVSFVKSFKPISAQLSLPQFLIEGDSTNIVGKLFNYSNDNYNVQSSFTINGNKNIEDQTALASKSSAIKNQTVVVNSIDTLNAAFALQTTTGFKDEEERKIPVLKKGTEETTGNFWIINTDTTINFKADDRSDKIELYAQNNTLDILLNEVEHLKQYPYFCNEQISSKLKGLLAEQKIKQVLNQPFNDDKTLQMLLQKLQKSQLYDGGWSWWADGRSNLYITTYIINALLPLRSNAVTETNIRNGLLYLQNQLNYLNRDELLTTLSTMSNANHLIDYTSWINKIHFASLTQYQQWLFIKIKQQQQLDYSAELQKILDKSIGGMLGSLHWGEDNYRWYNDANATTILAFDVLQHNKQHNDLLKGMMQYFLEQHSKGYWVNTVQSASIVSTVLPYIISINKNFNQQATLAVNGDTSFSIKTFPYQTTFNKNSVNQLSISKSGGSLMYCTLYQHYWNSNPQQFDKFYSIKSSFEKNGNRITTLKSGEVVTMKVEVNALKDADYVMIEIPIPAGCTYKERNQDDWNVHKEYLKNKIVIFAEHLNKGSHIYTIDLESRYNGNYTLNPAKVSLMYFPTFYGLDEMKKVNIQ